jgi:hypothetical protein
VPRIDFRLGSVKPSSAVREDVVKVLAIQAPGEKPIRPEDLTV